MTRIARLLFPLSLAAALAATGCAQAPNACNPNDLEHRAYIVSRDSDEVHVIDLNCLEVTGVTRTGGQSLHMGELNFDWTRLYVDSSDTNETVVVDTRKMTVEKRIATPRHPTHITLSRDGSLFAVMAEEDNMIMFLDPHTDQIIKMLPGFFTPHFARFSEDGKSAYIANLNAHHLTRIDLPSLSIAEYIPLDGFQGPPNETLAPDEGGFADAQIDQATGILYAAHISTGKVLMYDTRAHQKLPELNAGKQPWIVYAEHPFTTIQKQVVPSFGDEHASIISNKQLVASLPVADQESFGVNYSPLVPDEAFVMNRFKKEIAVVNTANNTLIDRIDVGGTTETASTTADGKLIVATVSSANEVVVIDAITHQIVKRFQLGHYPWSVTIPKGQNYCH
jgi:DNA-binding beta-propeller fold protein YncE